MSRRSVCWDNYNLETVDLVDSSDEDTEFVVSKRKKDRQINKSSRINKFRIDSESSSDDCVIYSSDDEKAIPPVTPSKISNLKLPKFSFETPDKKTSASNTKLLRDISNICQSATKTRRAKKTLSADSTRNIYDETTKVNNDLLFDSLLGIDRTQLKDECQAPPQKEENATYDDLLSKFNNLTTVNVPVDPDKDAASSTLFKRPSMFPKQKEVGNKVKRPGDSVIILRRTDDSDSSATEPTTDSKFTKDEPQIVRKSLENKPLLDETSDSDDCTQERRPPPKRKGKTTPYSLTDLKSALDEIDVEYSNRKSPNFLKSLNDDIDLSVCHPLAKMYKDKFSKKKEELTAVLYKLFNDRVFKSKLPGDMSLDWSGRMTSSAGITHLSRKMANSEWVFLARITLSKPIVTTTGRLRDTLIHEMCHAAVWLLDRKKDGHGPLWKNWTYKARDEFPELLPINTCHSYSKQWKFFWACVSCGYTIGRMTKSFDTGRFSCGRCHGKFELKTDDDLKKRKANGFALFVKENYSSVRTDGISHKEVMKTLSQKYHNLKPNREMDDIPADDDDLETIDLS